MIACSTTERKCKGNAIQCQFAVIGSQTTASSIRAGRCRSGGSFRFGRSLQALKADFAGWVQIG